MKFSTPLFLILLTGLFLSSGCIWFVPEGDVPPNLVGEQNTKPPEDAVPLKDAEAAMSGAIVRTLIRNGFSAEQVPVAFSKSSTNQYRSFIQLLHSTGMIRFVRPENAVFIIDSRLENGVWNLQLLKKNGTPALKKTVKYRQNP